MLYKKGPFSLANGEKEGLPYFLGVNKDFHSFDKKEDYPWFLKIEIDAENPTDDGLVSDVEADELNGLEDFFEEKLQAVTDIFFVGRITWNNVRYIYYYAADPKPIAELLNKLIDQGQYPREFKYEIAKDADWKKMPEIIPNIENI